MKNLLQSYIMSGPYRVALLLLLAGAAAMGSAGAKSYRLEVSRESKINETRLEAGTYTLKLNEEGEAQIYRGKEMILKTRAQVKPLQKGMLQNTVVQDSDGTIREVRFQKDVVVFSSHTDAGDVDSQLVEAAKEGSAGAVKELLAQGADVNGKDKLFGWTALMWAATKGHVDTVRVLLEAGADVTVRERNGWSAAMMAGNEGYLNIVRLIREAEAKE